MSRADSRANPSSGEAMNLAYRLHRRKLDLLQARADAAGEARGQIATLSPKQAGPAIDRLRELDRQIAQTEDALDRVYELLRPGADRQASRRTRAAALEIAQDRLDKVRTLLVDSGVSKAADRVRAANPTLAPDPGAGGGKVVISVISKKRK